MPSKIKVMIWAHIAGLSGFFAWLVSLPPENQDAIIKPMIELTPLTWRPALGLVARALATYSTIRLTYMLHKPQPPQLPQPPPQ